MSLEKRDDYFEPKKGSFYSIMGLVTFSTILPIKIYTTIEDMAKMTWFWPFINAFIGLFGVIFTYILYNMLNLPVFLVASLLYGFFIIINGCHHLDGLLDLSDAIMFQGSAEDKLKIMRDPITGTGAITSLFIVGISTIACYYTIINENLLWLILISEMSAKIGLLTCCISSKSGPEGLGKPFIEYLTLPQYIISIIICLIISFILSPTHGIYGVIGGILGGGIISLIVKKQMKTANGDALGASNEIGRLFSLLLIIISIVN